MVGPVLDESLFDVTTLIQDGYDDARSAELPVIARTAGQQQPPVRPTWESRYFRGG